MKVNTQSATIDAVQIQNLIPHAGRMSLLDKVLSFDAQGIVCIAHSHRDEANPLRENNILHAVCGIEYAAQAMALHGALLSTNPHQTPRAGRLAGVRSVQLSVSRLDDVPEELQICATQLMGDENSMVYDFTVKTSNRILLNGKATVVLVS